MTNIKTIERPQLFKALEEYIILWSNITVKYINTVKAVIKEAVTLKRSTHVINSNLTEKPFKTLNLLNYEIDVLILSNSHLTEEIEDMLEDFQNSTNFDAKYCNKRNKRLSTFQKKKNKQSELILSFIESRKLYD
ncbi:MAG: hypothetical protein COB67_08920 [SAR324 cluster bacterium]|uniref:Uncharacterized protein n=1 Tax=SAR324 cluster bacterium TaxID=2024889 RepID=A0A2A4T0W5_9DELT|nr:MAG: hypothetical protein COB67_08920 [SAR324 cluster bacterium]